MPDDISETAGFGLRFDSVTLAVQTAPAYSFTEVRRTVADTRTVLETPDAAPQLLELYRTYASRRLPAHVADRLERLNLTYSLVVVKPLRVGREYARTHGHIHAPMVESAMTSPEVYALLRGHLILLLQRYEPGSTDSSALDDFVTIPLKAGDVVVIPPNYAHALANTWGEPGVLAGLYGNPELFPPVYDGVDARGGFGYRLVAEPDGGTALVPNDRYARLPLPRSVAAPFPPPFAAPEPGVPLLASFLADPDGYAFLTRTAAAVERFGPGGRLAPG